MRLHWLIKACNIIEFAGFYLVEVIASNLRVARDVLYPSNRIRPGIIKLNVKHLTDQQLIAISNLITMTPGTLTLDVNSDSGELLIHSLYVEDPKLAAKAIEKQFIERIQRVF